MVQTIEITAAPIVEVLEVWPDLEKALACCVERSQRICGGINTLDFTLSKDQLMIQKAFREFAEQFIEPAVEEIEKTCVIPPAVIKGLGEMGVFGMAFPEEYGGSDAGYLALVLALEQIAKVSSGISNVIGAHYGSAGIIRLYGSEAQKQKYLPKCCSGEHIASVA